MAISAQIRNNWIEIQKKFDYPVNAIGVRIADKDEKTLAVWQSECIDIEGRLSDGGMKASEPLPIDEVVNLESADGLHTIIYRGVAMQTEVDQNTQSDRSGSTAPVLKYRGVAISPNDE